MSRAVSSHGLDSSSDLSYQFFLCLLGISGILNRLLERMYPSLGNMFPWLEICYRLSSLVTWAPHSAVCLALKICLEICCFP